MDATRSRNNTRKGSYPNVAKYFDKAKNFTGLSTANGYSGKVRSFYPSCELPRNTDEELWKRSHTMNLHFDLSIPNPSKGTNVTVLMATLRLFKFNKDNESSISNECTPPIPTVHNPQPLPYSHTSFSIPPNDKRIRVSVYWYTRSLKRHRIKRKFLDSRMVSESDQSWTVWDVRPAAESWMEAGKNFGIAVEVEDEDEQTLQASNYFVPMNCSLEASSMRPIPGQPGSALMLNKAHHSSVCQPIQPHHYPFIEIATIEIPESELSRNRFGRIRHHNQHHSHHHNHHHGSNDSTDHPASGSPSGGSSNRPQR